MKLKNTIFANGFVEAFVRLKNQKFPVATAWKLDKINEVLVKESEAYFAAKQKLLEEHGKRDKKGNLVTKMVDGKETVELEHPDKFNKDFQELLEIEQEYDFKKIELPSNFEMTAMDLGLLKDILVIK